MIPFQSAVWRLVAVICLGAAVLGIPAQAAADGGHFSALEEVQINHVVAGDVIVLAGTIELGPQADVEGHVIAILGSITRHTEARVGGRLIAVSSLANLAVQPGLDPDITLVDAAVRILSSGGWLLVTSILALLAPARIRQTAREVPGLGFRLFLLGFVVALTLFATLVGVLGLGETLGPPLAATVMLAFFVIKAIGLAIVGSVLGKQIVGRLSSRRLPMSFAVFAGVAVFLIARLLPFVGGALWTLISVTALGAGLYSLATSSDQVHWQTAPTLSR